METKSQGNKNGFSRSLPAEVTLRTIRGKLITFEGIEGSGKSSHARLLARAMRAEGRDVLEVREPGGTRLGEAIRRLLCRRDKNEQMTPRAELLLFLASRAQLVQNVILPALRRGALVVCDRFYDSTTAYQGYARGCEQATLALLNAFAVQNLVPDLTVLLDLNLQSGFKRLGDRNRRDGKSKDRIESESVAFHRRVRMGYLDLARKNPERFRVIDSDRPIERVQADILEAVKSVIARRNQRTA